MKHCPDCNATEDQVGAVGGGRDIATYRRRGQSDFVICRVCGWAGRREQMNDDD